MSIKPFLITGCGRSGTRYMGAFLTMNGIPTGWESVLQPNKPFIASAYTKTLRRLKLAGDSNWLSVPYMPRMPGEVVVLHQTRHPLNVVRSMLGLRFFGDDYLMVDRWQACRPHAGIVTTHLPGLCRLRTAVERCLYYWVHWNELCERYIQDRGFTSYRYQFEQAINWDSGVMLDVWKVITTWPEPEEWKQPEAQNQLFVDPEPFGWDRIPNGELKETGMALGERYGYPR